MVKPPFNRAERRAASARMVSVAGHLVGTPLNVIVGYNYQGRKFADFWAWESQNWMMLSGVRAVGSGRLTAHGMISLEPFTIAAGGLRTAWLSITRIA